MKKYSIIAFLVVLGLFLTLTACTLSASKAPAVTPTATGEIPFPFETPQEVGNFGTQTAIALTPGALALATETPSSQTSGETPQVIINTPTVSVAAPGQTQSVPQPTTAGVAVNTPVVARPTTYVLQKGEWPICIARRFNLDITSFFATNGFNMDSKPSAGTTLKIPASGNWNPNYGSRTLKAHPAPYIVVSGDTANTIACKYGDVTPEAILAVNGLSSGSALKVGTSLKIP